jgi:hypothetical protein
MDTAASLLASLNYAYVFMPRLKLGFIGVFYWQTRI